MLRDVLGSQEGSGDARLTLPKTPRSHTEDDAFRWNTSTKPLGDVGIILDWEPVRVQFYTSGWFQDIIEIPLVPGPVPNPIKALVPLVPRYTPAVTRLASRVDEIPRRFPIVAT